MEIVMVSEDADDADGVETISTTGGTPRGCGTAVVASTVASAARGSPILFGEMGKTEF